MKSKMSTYAAFLRSVSATGAALIIKDGWVTLVTPTSELKYYKARPELEVIPGTKYAKKVH